MVNTNGEKQYWRSIKKRLFSVCLAVLILLGTLPFSAAAAEGGLDQEELIELACEVFPEYEEYLKNPPASVSTRSGNSDIGEVVSSETRSISDSESMTATLYSTGYVVVGYVYDYFEVSISDSGSQVASDFIGSASFTVATNAKGLGEFSLRNVSFIIHQNNTGYFTSYGAPSPNELVTYSTVSNSTTSIVYNLSFKYGGIYLYTRFSLSINNGKVVVTVN